MVRLSDNVRFKGKWVVFTIGGGNFVANIETNEMFGVTGPGAILLEAAQVGYSIEYAASVIEKKIMDCPPLELIETDLLEFAKHLIAEGILEIAD